MSKTLTIVAGATVLALAASFNDMAKIGQAAPETARATPPPQNHTQSPSQNKTLPQFDNWPPQNFVNPQRNAVDPTVSKLQNLFSGALISKEMKTLLRGSQVGWAFRQSFPMDENEEVGLSLMASASNLDCAGVSNYLTHGGEDALLKKDDLTLGFLNMVFKHVHQDGNKALGFFTKGELLEDNPHLEDSKFMQVLPDNTDFHYGFVCREAEI